MQRSLDLQSVPEDANGHFRAFLEGNKVLEMKLKQLRQYWKIPLNARSSFLSVQTSLKNLSLCLTQFSHVALGYTQCKFVFRGVSLGTTVTQFCSEKWCRSLFGTMLCFGVECSVHEKGWRTLADHSLSFLCYRRYSAKGLCCLDFNVHHWLLGTFLGWTDSHFGGTFPFPGAWEEAEVQLLDVWNRVK